MKSKKITLILSFMLVFVLIFGSVSAAAVDETSTTEPLTTVAYDDEEKSDDYWDGYNDGYDEGYHDAESEDYDSGYEDGYYDGYYDGEYEGYEDGYYQGYYDGVNAYEDPSFFEKAEDFIYELCYRIESFIDGIKDLIQKIFKTGDYAPTTPVDPDADFIPDGTQSNLGEDEAAAALCDEFNQLIEGFCDVDEYVLITKNVDVGIEIKDIPDVVQSVANEIIEQFAMNTSTTNEYYEGDYAYEVQSTWLFPDGLVSAEKTVNDDGTTDYEFVLVSEAAYYDGYETAGVKYINGEFYYGVDLQHDYAADTIYIESVDLSPVTIKSAEIYYPGATITATTDEQGRLIAYDVNMPVSGTGEAKIAFLEAVVSVDGYRNEGFVFEYAE